MKNLITHLKTNAFLVLSYNFALILLLNAVCRALFWAFNTGFFPEMSAGHFSMLMLAGVRFDIVGLVYVNLLYILAMLLPFKFRFDAVYQRVLKYVFVITNAIALAANCADIIYFRFTLRRTTAAVFQEFGNEGNMLQLFGGFFIQYWYVLLIFIVLTMIMGRFFATAQKPKIASAWRYYLFNSLLCLLGMGLWVAGARGDFSTLNRPITLSNAAEYTSNPAEMAMVQSTPMAVIKTLFEADVERYKFFETEEELAETYSPEHHYISEKPFQKKNVVILILESFGAEYVTAYNRETENYQSYTPFLDSLMSVSRYYSYSYANGRKSIDAMPSILAGIPSVGNSYVLTPYSTNKINGIATILRREGYETAFFHGAPNGSMGFNGIANLAGFERYFGMTEYDNNADFDRTGGIFDEEFLQYYALKMSEMTEPFCTAVFTLSSHTPFTIPDRYKDRFTGAPDAFHNVLLYSDYALRRFFETAKRQKWYENTLFVLSADHGGTYLLHDEYKNSVGVMAIPIVFFAPNDTTLRGEKQRLAQQSDILPTVLSYLNYGGDFVAFGNNLFLENEDDIVVNSPNICQLFWRDYAAHFDGKKLTALYRYKEDKLLKHNLIGTLPEEEKLLTAKAKAFLQQYNNRLIDNKLSK